MISNSMGKMLFWGSAMFFIYTVFLQLIGSYDLNYFDGAVQLASQNYTALGLTPYKDFAVVYPPGTFLLSGKLLPFKSIVEVNVFFTIIFVGLFAAAVKLFNKLNPQFGYVMWLANGFLLRIFDARGALPYVMLETIVLLVLCKKKWQLLVMSAVFVWLRWDWLLFFLPFAGVWAAAGYLIGVLALAGYLVATGVWGIGWEFIVYIPMMLTGYFRDLPIPPFAFDIHPNLLIYVSGAMLLIIGLKLRSKLKDYLVFLGFVGIFVPYALGRSDWVHFVGVWMATAFWWTFVCRDLKVRWMWSTASIILFFIPLGGWYARGVKSFEPTVNKVQITLDEQISNCRELVKGENPKSIFVGRLTYQRYLYNVAALYLAYPKVKPATRFIMEEPGIQNSCKYGGMAVADLEGAGRPMLAYLEKGLHEAENEAMAKMESCGKMESFLQAHEFAKIGGCTAYNKEFEVRVYK